jgi:hypothetical protein
MTYKMGEPLETFTNNAHTIELHFSDDILENPLLCDGYTETVTITNEENARGVVLSELGYACDEPKLCAECTKTDDFCIDCENREEKRQLRVMAEIALVLPIYKFEHGGVAFSAGSFSCPWDSGFVGYIALSKATIRGEYGVKRISKKLREKVEARFDAIIAGYSA